MQKQYYTIVVFPGNTGNPKKIRVSKFLVKATLYTFLTLFIGIAGSSAYFSKQYYQLLLDRSELTDLRRDGKIQKVQVEKFSQQVKNFETEMARLERFEKKLRVITALESSPKAMEKSWGVGGPYGLASHSFSTSLEKETQAMVERLSEGLEHLTNQAKMQVISFQELDEYLKSQKSLLSATPSIWPARGWVTSSFGFRKSPFTGSREKHEGWDIAARTGSPVLASADGVVIVAGRDSGYGNLVEIDHGYGLVSRYGHNSRYMVKVGERVKRGQTISYVGNTGRSTGPHLHYEVVLNGVSVDPQNYILED